jgi:hypothetical protein
VLVAPGVAAATVPVIIWVGVAVTGAIVAATVAVTVSVTTWVTLTVRVGVIVVVAVGGRVLVGIVVGVDGSLSTTWVGEGAAVTERLVAEGTGEIAAAAVVSPLGSRAFSWLPQLTRNTRSKR